METKIIFDEARNGLVEFFSHEFKGFDNLLLQHFLNRINDFLNYDEEGQRYKPKFIFTNDINALTKNIKSMYKLPLYEDENASNFDSRIKTIIALATNDWCIYVELKEDKINYGICKALNSIKDKDLLSLIESDESLQEKDKLYCIIARVMSFYLMTLTSLRGNKLSLNFSLDPNKQFRDETNIDLFVDATFSKLRTTKQKLNVIKTMYTNIIKKVINEVNGAICVVVDKEYKDTGFFSDGIWLKEPISFNKLFTNSKSYSEEKLQAFVQLFVAMLQFDGITVVDNYGRIRGYNIFVETDIKKLKNIVGGARKRAAYTIINSRRKHIMGVYFQSHEGEIFYEPVKGYLKKKPTPSSALNAPTVTTITTSPQKLDNTDVSEDISNKL